MKRKILKYFRLLMVVTLAGITCGCVSFDNYKITEKPFVDKTSVELYIGEGAGDRSQIQLVSSPSGKQYKWNSLDPTVATVSQTGLITALSEGFAVITIASANDQTNVDVWVRKWVPLEDFLILGKDRIIASRSDRFQIIAVPEPLNASEVDIQWSSSNPQAIQVFENGWVVCNDLGGAFITAKADEIEKKVEVQAILGNVLMDRSKWSVPGYATNIVSGIGWSSQDVPANLVAHMFDDNLATFWHASWGAGGSINTDYPHWFIVDLGEEVIITHVSMTKRRGFNNMQRGFELFTSTEANAVNLSDPDTWEWESQGEFNFNPGTSAQDLNDFEQKYPLAEFPSARYVKVYMGTKFKGANNYAQTADFKVYIGIY